MDKRKNCKFAMKNIPPKMYGTSVDLDLTKPSDVKIVQFLPEDYFII